MRKQTKRWLMIATCLLLIGCAVFGGVMMRLKWDFTKLSTVKFETNRYEIDEAFQSVSIDSDTADVIFVPSEGTETVVECHEQSKIKHVVEVKDGVLTIKLVDTRKWYEHIGISFGSPKITVTLPQGEYDTLSVKNDTGDIKVPNGYRFESMTLSASTGDVKASASADTVKIKTSTGRIDVEGIAAGSMELSVTTGRVHVVKVDCTGDVSVRVSTGKTFLTDLSCQSLHTEGDTGDLFMQNVVSTMAFSIKRSTGDVVFNGCDAAEIHVKTSTGNVRGSLRSDKVFLTSTNTGSVHVPSSVSGGRCEIHTSTGDIKIEIPQK